MFVLKLPIAVNLLTRSFKANNLLPRIMIVKILDNKYFK